MATALRTDDSMNLYGLQPTYTMGPDAATTEESRMNQPLLNSPGSGLSYEAYDFTMSGATFQPDIDMGPVDWMWPLPQIDLLNPLQVDIDLTDGTRNQPTDPSNLAVVDASNLAIGKHESERA